jgi:5-methyltetrahydrofolate--homocysteine methyltransferase
MLAQSYRGSRYSFGYLASPTLDDKRELLATLNADEIGTTLYDEDQLHLEQ